MPGATVSRRELIQRLVTLVDMRRTRLGLRIAIDGPDAAGKTTLANDLAGALDDHGLPVVRASIDGFHNPAVVRHRRRDDDAALSYYEDSFDLAAVRRLLLDPLGTTGDRLVRTRVFDHRSDTPVEEPAQQVETGAVLLFDGVFLLRPELIESWDLTVYLRVDPDESLQRARTRDISLFGSIEATERQYDERYLPGQALYRSIAHPEQRCDTLIDNDDPEHPRILRFPEVDPTVLGR